ncbi:hypothetical protein FA95DRAFT_669686 [Auriscalpium vulgare]|uniref:Uncharacterized protein n=1 Tax=Auriscalpium vulgare TaxID=40419 RepID=A0ACB8RBY1_9AGAM|nr:hypothetical protein FA95DRAFT_669686 [Auriscalpium vulgare]
MVAVSSGGDKEAVDGQATEDGGIRATIALSQDKAIALVEFQPIKQSARYFPTMASPSLPRSLVAFAEAHHFHCSYAHFYPKFDIWRAPQHPHAAVRYFELRDAISSSSDWLMGKMCGTRQLILSSRSVEAVYSASGRLCGTELISVIETSNTYSMR